MEKIRLSKLMADRGLCSRREADRYIEQGLVLVNGVTMDVLGTKVEPSVKVELKQEARQQRAQSVTILMHKPVGIVSGQAEKGYTPAIELIRPRNQFREKGAPHFSKEHLRGLAPAGRLDIESTGLLILTQDGRIARKLIGENSQIEKEYLVRVEGTVNDDVLRRLRFGLELDGKPLKRARVDILNEDQLRFVLKEGKKRQIRRMCDAVNLKVTGLKRVRIGKIRLGKLPEGQWRYLRKDEYFD